MLGRKASISSRGLANNKASTASAMPPPPTPAFRPTASMVVDDYTELENLIQQAYVSPDMTMSDSAVFGFGSASAGTYPPIGGTLSNTPAGSGSATGTPGGVGSGVDPDLDSLLNLWMSPSTQNLPTPLSSFSTSPALYASPFSDHLSTPALDPLASFTSNNSSFVDQSPDIVSASPSGQTSGFNLFEDLDSSTTQSLFNELMAHATAAQQLAASANNGKAPLASNASSSTIKPTELGLQLQTSAADALSRHSSWENASSTSSLSVSPQSLDSRNLPTSPTGTASGTSQRGGTDKSANGVRKNVQVKDLIPLDAPIQARNYITPSATSRKDVPPSVARTFVPTSRKRSSQAAGLPSIEDMQDELAAEDDPAVVEALARRREMDPEKAALLEHVEQSRRRNTLAARKSRQRKLEHVRTLEELVDMLRAENEELKKKEERVEEENQELRRKLREMEERLQESLGGVPSTST